MKVETLFDPGQRVFVCVNDSVQAAQVIVVFVHVQHTTTGELYLEHNFKVMVEEDGEVQNVKSRQIAATKAELLAKL